MKNNIPDLKIGKTDLIQTEYALNPFFASYL